jgi:hypothetical protein
MQSRIIAHTRMSLAHYFTDPPVLLHYMQTPLAQMWMLAGGAP